jgi:hypothetical protein
MMFARDLRRGVAQDALGALIPRLDLAVRAHQEDRVVLDILHEKPKLRVLLLNRG